MLKSKIFLIFVFLLIWVFIIPATAAGQQKIESNLLKQDPGSFVSQFQNQYAKKVVLEMNSTDRSYIKSLEDNGAVIEAVHKNHVQVSVPASQLQAISEKPFVNYVRSPRRPYKDVISQGAGVINASLVNNMGFTGQNVKIAIIDVGFRDYQFRLGTELPASVTARSFRADGDITGGGEDHGTRVAEIVFDIAPDAQFYLLNFDTDVEFANAVDFAISQGVDVISMSVSFLTGPFDGTGTIDDVVNNATSSGIVWTNSAGNYAHRHWEGKFNDPDGNGIHNFSGTDESMSINLPSGGSPAGGDIEIFLSWDDWPASNQDYDLCVYNGTDVQLACSANLQTGTQEPVEFLISPPNLPPDTYNFKIHKFSATRNVTFELYSPLRDLEYQVASGSLGIPADAPGVITTGATFWADDVLEPFSSQGPTKDGRTKPDVVAPDGVDTAFHLLTPFFGTSASTPHVAGAAALLVQAAKKQGTPLSPSRMKRLLENASIDLGTPGKDNLYGAGRINVFPAVISLDTVGPSVTANPAVYLSGSAAARNGTRALLSAAITDAITGVKNASVNVSAINPSLNDLPLIDISGSWMNSVTVNASDGTYLLNVTAFDSVGNVNDSVQLSVTVDNRPAVTVSPKVVITGSATNVTINVTQGDLPVGDAEVTMSGAANGSGITDANGTVNISVNSTNSGIITVTASKTGLSNRTVTLVAADPFVRGDASGDGKADIVDALFVAQQTVGLRTFTITQSAAADVNADGVVSIVDALFIAQATVGLRILQV